MGRIVGSLAYLAAGAAALPATSAAAADPPPPTASRGPPPVISRAPPPVLAEGQPARFLVTADGRSLILDGEITHGAAQRFSTALAAAPGVKRVVLHSSGGLILEAGVIADAIRKRGLDTYVETLCVSACTIILLAGRDRAGTPMAKIGFHDFTFPVSSPGTVARLRSWGRHYHDDAGVSPTFTDRALATPAASVWYPADAELLAAHVLTRVSLGGETALISTLITNREQLEKDFASLPFWKPLKEKHPDVAAAFVEAAWRAKEQGKTDAELTTAGRAVMIAAFPRIMDNAGDETLVKYLDLLLDQVRAARAVSYEACDGIFTGTLNPLATLPRALATREQDLILEALSAPPQHRAKPKTVEQLLPILTPLFQKLPPDQLKAISGGEKGSYSKPARCEGMLALLLGVKTLPREQQVEVLRTLFLT